MSSPLSKSANQFAADLFQCYLRRHGDKYRNLLLCPYLIYHSLAMMLVGAKGRTAEQLMKVLRINPNHQYSGASSASCASSSATSSQASENPSTANAIDMHIKISDTKLRYLNRSSSRASSMSSLGTSVSSNVSSTLADPYPSRSSRPASRSSSRLSSRSNGSGSTASRASSKQSTGRNAAAAKLIIDDTTVKSTLDAPSVRVADADEARHREFLMLTEQVMHGNHEFIHLASFIYLDKGTKRIERFKAILRDYYETKPKKIDFDNVELMVRTVNEDVARTTENIYNDLLSKQEAQKLEKSYMLLVNAVFFRGFWLTNFTDVKKSVFTRYSSKRLDPKQSANFPTHYQVMMMSKLDYLPVVQDEQLEAKVIRMPFEASDLEMLLLLPNNPQSDSTYLCERFSTSKFNTVLDEFSKTKNRTVRVSMPVFCIDSGKISIQSTLVEMGARDLFDKSKADMSGVCENKQVWLHKILHRCFIICDNRGSITSSSFEKAKRQSERSTNQSLSQSSGMGSSSSSSTTGNMSSGRDSVEQVTADHPFMYIIFDSVTRTILLIGLYTDPSETLEVIHENQLSAEEAHQIYTEGVYKT